MPAGAVPTDSTVVPEQDDEDVLSREENQTLVNVGRRKVLNE